MKELTRAEEQVMQILWKLGKGFVKDVVEEFDEPKPAYNTVSTIIRILETKGFIDHTAYGKTYEYFPTISRDEYKRKTLKTFVGGYFNNSFRQLVSFFSKENDLSAQELEEMINLMQKELETKKSNGHE
jgi:BlaI family transcriptional regulator, penicillinase repressor